MGALGPRVVVAGTHSGVGKTTVATGLMAALRRRGDRVAPAKVGPGLHRSRLPRPRHGPAGPQPRRLDLRRATPIGAAGGAGGERRRRARRRGGHGSLRRGGRRHAGVDRATSPGCSTRPVVLVVDASAMSRSVAALVHGFATFDRAVRVAGVILNRVGSRRRTRRMLREALEPLGIPVLGVARAATTRSPGATATSGWCRWSSSRRRCEQSLERLADTVERTCDLDAMLGAGPGGAAPRGRTTPPTARPVGPRPRRRRRRARRSRFTYPRQPRGARGGRRRARPVRPAARRRASRRGRRLVRRRRLPRGVRRGAGRQRAAARRRAPPGRARARRRGRSAAGCSGSAAHSTGRPMCGVVDADGTMTRAPHARIPARADAGVDTPLGPGRHRAARPRVPLLEPRARGRRARRVRRFGQTARRVRVAACSSPVTCTCTSPPTLTSPSGSSPPPRADLRAPSPRSRPRGYAPRAAVYGKPVRVRRGPATVTGERPSDVPPETPGRRGRARIREPGDRLRRREKRPTGMGGTGVGRRGSRPRRSRARHARAVARPATRPIASSRRRWRSTSSAAPRRSCARPAPEAAGRAARLRHGARRRRGDGRRRRRPRIAAALDGGERVAFVTLGDPNVYSTFSSLARAVRALRPDAPIETVAGIMAFQALAARAGFVVLEGTESLSLITALDGPEALDDALADPGPRRRRVQGRTTPPRDRQAARRRRPASTARSSGELLGPPGRACRPPGRGRRRAGQLPRHGARPSGGSAVISFVGAGPGAPDLITLRGRDRLATADVVVWASSLVPEALLDHAPPTVEVHDSAGHDARGRARRLQRASRRPHRAPPLRRPCRLRRHPGADRLVRRARARLRDRARRELAERGRRRAGTRADHPDGGAERGAHAARRPHRGVDAGAGVGRGVRGARRDHGRVPLGARARSSCNGSCSPAGAATRSRRPPRSSCARRGPTSRW